MTTKDTRAELRRLLAAATPRPWSALRHGVVSRDPATVQTFRDRDGVDSVAYYGGGALISESMSSADAALVAFAVNMLEALLDNLDAKDELEPRLAALESEFRDLRRAQINSGIARNPEGA